MKNNQRSDANPDCYEGEKEMKAVKQTNDCNGKTPEAKEMDTVKHTVDFVGRIPGTNVDEWKVVLKYNDKEVTLPYKIEKGFMVSDHSIESILDTYFKYAERVRPYPTVELFHKGYVPHFDLPKAEEFYNALKTVKMALDELLGEDYRRIENQVFKFIENERRRI
ncbi:hypothetical protein [Bacillus cereus]|uniref:hypothetical protein n=1 Tax=Bacillus cereus TaxID=1396 RepID=UPI000B4B2FFA|nr:hypothetical protein [Bacillus cereus]